MEKLLNGWCFARLDVWKRNCKNIDCYIASRFLDYPTIIDGMTFKYSRIYREEETRKVS